jgi:hypothetical protein
VLPSASLKLILGSGKKVLGALKIYGKLSQKK